MSNIIIEDSQNRKLEVPLAADSKEIAKSIFKFIHTPNYKTAEYSREQECQDT